VLLSLTLLLALAPDVPPTEASALAENRSRVFVEAPLALSAQGTASRVETVLTPWAGLRAGWLSHDDAGVFFGGDGAILAGLEGGGTVQVALSKLPVLLEGRGLVGLRHRVGLFAVGGYGYGSVGVGGGPLVVSAFDDTRARIFGTWSTRLGAGGELAFGAARLRIELGTGVRDARFDLHGAVAAGAAF
jgi:hypothetical protein